MLRKLSPKQKHNIKVQLIYFILLVMATFDHVFFSLRRKKKEEIFGSWINFFKV